MLARVWLLAAMAVAVQVRGLPCRGGLHTVCNDVACPGAFGGRLERPGHLPAGLSASGRQQTRTAHPLRRCQADGPVRDGQQRRRGRRAVRQSEGLLRRHVQGHPEPARLHRRPRVQRHLVRSPAYGGGGRPSLHRRRAGSPPSRPTRPAATTGTGRRTCRPSTRPLAARRTSRRSGMATGAAHPRARCLTHCFLAGLHARSSCRRAISATSG